MAVLSSERPSSATAAASAPEPTTRLHHRLLAGVLVLHAVLSLRAPEVETPFEDEALYLYIGHRMIEHATTGAAVFEAPGSFFTGAPAAYPVLGAVADSLGGLGAARLLALVFTTAALVCVAGLGRSLFGPTAGLLAALAAGLQPGVLYISSFATHDAPMFFLLAAASWAAVVSAQRDGLRWWPGVALLLALAVTTKYAAALYAPFVAGLALAAGRGRFGGVVLRRCVLMGLATAALLGVGLLVWGQSLIPGLVSQTLAREALNPATPVRVVGDALLWAGPWYALMLAGAVVAPRRQRLLVVLLAVASVVAVVQHARIEEGTSLPKHVGIGILFAAPLVGLAGSALLRRYGRETLVLVLAAGVVLGLSGVRYSAHFLTDWVSDAQLVDQLRTHVEEVGGAPVLGEQPAPERYALREVVAPEQWRDTYYFTYEGQAGMPAYEAAFTDRHFGLVYLSGSTGDGPQIQAYLDAHPELYRPVGTVNRLLRDDVVGQWTIYRPTP